MKLICCNFKMNLLKKDIDNYLKIIDNRINKENIVFFPSIPHINKFIEKGYLVGSQDISFQEFGSITGDTSIIQLKELGISYTIIGHSERRKYFDDDKYISKKIKIALENNIKVILCIGESIKLTEKEANIFLKDQIDSAIDNNLNLIKNNLIIAYEPIWAIGSGVMPDEKYLSNTISFIKNYVMNIYNLNLKVLYGGSINLDNIKNIEKITEIDGYLIGGSSLNPEIFLSIISNIK